MKNQNKSKDQQQKNTGKESLTLIMEGVLVGALAGLTAIFYRFCLLWAENGLFHILEFIQGNIPAIILWFLALILMGCLVARVVRLEPMAAGSGIPQVAGEIKGIFDLCWWRILLAKFVGGTISIFGGLSLGRSGPSVQLGAMAAKSYTRARNYDKQKEIGLLACGAGAGLAATFNAPFAGLMFVLEELHHTFDRTILAAGFAATISASYISRLFFGQSALFSFSTSSLPLSYYGLLALFGIVSGLAAVGYCAVLLNVQSLFQYFNRIPKEISISAVFVVSGILGLFLPQVLAGGNRIIHLLEGDRLALLTLALLLFVKFIFSALSTGSGVPGGIFFPLLVLGACTGALFGSVVFGLFPLSAEFYPQFIVLGIAGLFSGVVQTPLTAILLITEMTGSLHSMLDVAIVCILSCVVANLLGSKPVCASLLENVLKQTGKKA